MSPITFKKANPQNIIPTTLANDFTVTIKNLYLFTPTSSPIPTTQVMFKEAIKNCFTLSSDSGFTDRKPFESILVSQLDIAECLKVAHQSFARIGVPNETNKVAVFDKNDFRENFVER